MRKVICGMKDDGKKRLKQNQMRIKRFIKLMLGMR